jgi:hypothetical protein
VSERKLASDKEDMGFRVGDDLAALIKGKAGEHNARFTSVVTDAIRQGLASMLHDSSPTISAVAADAGFSQFHALLTSAERNQLEEIRSRTQYVGRSKTPLRFVLRECLLRGLAE